MAELVNEYIGTYDSIIVNHYFACKFCCITDDAATAQLTVVSHVHTLHEEVVASDNSLALWGSTTGNGYILTNTVVVANLAQRFFSTVFKVLWLGCYACSRKYLVVVSQAGTSVYCHTVLHYVVVADFYITVDVAERTDDVVIAKLCFGMYVC